MALHDTKKHTHADLVFPDFPEGMTKEDLKNGLIILIVLSCLSPLMAICHLYGSYKVTNHQVTQVA